MNPVAFTLIPMGLFVLGASLSGALRLTPAMSSAMQHLAAGLVFAAAATEVLPDLQHQGSALAIVIGGGLGLFAMFSIKLLGARFPGPAAMIALIGLDIFIDGIVLGVSFAGGVRHGLILLIALAVEIAFLGLAAGEGLFLILRRYWKVIAAALAGGLLLPIGALVGGPIHALPPSWLAMAYAFALISLLYLVTEELLVEAHHKPDSPLITSMFFIGFLGLLAIEQAIPP
ncbi:MAG: transporter [Hyphomonadaceae bacterium]|nr:transporter [Hyphomonadaceae bacterium]